MNFRLIAPIFALLLSVAFLLMGNGFQGTLLPMRANMEGFGAFSIGILGSMYFVGFVLGCVFVPKMVRAVGHIRTFTALVALASAVTLAHALFVWGPAWWILRAMTGFCLSGLYMIVESWLNARATPETRGTIMGIYMVVNLGVITIGQMLVVVYAPETFAAFALASILISLAAVPVAFTRSQQPEVPPDVRFAPKKMFLKSPAAYVGCVFVGLGNGAIWSLALLYTADKGLGVEPSALFLSLIILGGALSQFPIGKISDKRDRRKVLLWTQLVTAALSVAFGIGLHFSHMEMMVLALVYGMFMLPGYSLAAAHAFDHAEVDEYVQISAGLLLVNGIGSIIGPLLASGLMQAFGSSALFLFTGTCQMGLVAYLFLRVVRKRRTLKPKDKEDFTLETAAPLAPTVPFTISEEFIAAGADGAVVKAN